MTAVIQRVIKASVKINNSKISSIDNGLVILLGVHKDDTEKEINYLVKKIIDLRIFNDDDKRMNCSLQDVNGSVLIISQFTLCGELQKGRRPSFLNAADPKKGKSMYDKFVEIFKGRDFNVKTGEFGSQMDVKLINTGPATFVIDTNKESIAVAEANQLGIRSFAMTDTNTNPKIIDFPIPANDDASKSIECIVSIVKTAIAEGLEERGAEQEAQDEKKKEKAKQISEEKQ